MRIQITAPESIRATIQLPASKSISNRALVINRMGGNVHRPENLSDCQDTEVMIRALDKGPHEDIDVKAAGTAMRFLTALCATMPGERLITGTGRMQQRPIKVLVDALRQLGADIEYAGNEGFPPLRICGSTLTEDHISLSGNVSSQYISALLMIGPTMPHGLTIQLEGDIISRPYIDLTLRLMEHYGAKAYWAGNRTLKVEPQPYRSVPLHVENDWSAASYWYEIVALAKEATVTLPGLFEDSCQGDSKVAELFRPLGVETLYGDKTVTLRKTGRTARRMEFDFIGQPDLAQTFVVTCALMGIPFRFSGLQSLKIKETDRMAALIKEMAKLGFVIREEEGSILSWEGERCERTDGPIDTYEDHRMAMAFAPACIVFPRGVRINDHEVVTKSYPTYWDTLRTAGFNIIKE